MSLTINDTFNKTTATKYDPTSSSGRKHPCRSAFAQLVATLIQGWLFFEIGIKMSVPTMVIGELYKNPDSTGSFKLDDDQASWFGSLPNLFFPISSLFSALLQEVIGRKGSMILVNIPSLIAWLILYFADSVSDLYASAVIMGLCSGLSEASLHCYIGEIAEPHLRGTLTAISSSAVLLGSLSAYILGYYFDWRKVVLISSACPVIALICMTQIPESPTWLIARNRLGEAKKSLCWVRGWIRTEAVEDEFQSLVIYVRRSTGKSRGNLNSSNSIQSKGGVSASALKTEIILMIKAMTTKEVLRPLRMVFILFVISSVACGGGIEPYLISELRTLRIAKDPELYMAMLNVVYFVASILYLVFLPRVGKRNFALLSHGIAAISILGMGLYCSHSFVVDEDRNPHHLASLLVLLYFVEGLGIVVLPWQLTSEVFPPVGRGLATGISAAWMRLFYFVLIKSFLYMEACLGLSGVMYIFAGATVLGCVYIYFYFPETEGKNLEEIESYFTRSSNKKEKVSIGHRNISSHL